MPPESEKREISCRVINSIIQYTVNTLGVSARLLDGLDYQEKYLTDTDNWVTADFTKKIITRLKNIFKDDEIMYQVGLQALSLDSLGAVDQILKYTCGQQALLKFAESYNLYFTKISRLTVCKRARREAILECEALAGYVLSADDCNYLKGLLASLPRVWGMGFAKVKEIQCAAPIKGRGKINGKFYSLDSERNLWEYDLLQDSVTGKNGRMKGDRFKQLMQHLDLL